MEIGTLLMVKVGILIFGLMCLVFASSAESASPSKDFSDRYLLKKERVMDLPKDGMDSRPYRGLKKAAILFLETAGGCTLNLVSLLVVANYIVERVERVGGDSPEIIIVPVFAMTAPLSSSIGVSGVGYLLGQRGSWMGSFIGALACPLLAIPVYFAIHETPGLDSKLMPFYVASLCSPIGAVVGYNVGDSLSRHKWLCHPVVLASLCASVVFACLHAFHSF